MADFESKKHIPTQESTNPINSINLQGKDSRHVQLDAAEQEALWNRSLEFFQMMNAQSTTH